MTDYLQLARERAAGALPADDVNPYLPIALDAQKQQHDLARSMIERALADQPDLAAERQRLSQTSGLPLSVIERNLDEVRRKEAVRALDLINLAQDSPVLARQLADPRFTSVAVDDISTLDQIEKTVGNTARYVLGASEGGGLPGQLGRGIQASPSASAGAVAGVKRAAVDVIEPWARLVAGDDNWFAQMSKYYAGQAKLFGDQTKAILGTAQGNVDAGVSAGAMSFATNLKYLPFAFTGPAGAALALAGMVGESFGTSYNKAADKNLPLWQSLGYASADAMVEYWTEKLPLDKLIGGIRQGAPFLQTFAKQLGYEIPGEQLATVLQDLNEWATLNPGKPFSDYLRERPDAAVQTLIATVIGTGGNVMVTSSIGNVLDTISGSTQWRENVVTSYADLLQQQLSLAGQSTLRERSPEQFRSLVQQITESNDGAPKSVYVDGEVLNQLAPEVLNQLPAAVQAQIAEAAVSGGVVEIPMADVLTVAPGTPLEEVLNQHARMDPFAMSLAESQAAGQKAQEFLQQEAQRVIEQAADQEAMRASAEAVRTSILSELNATGRFRPQVNEAMSQWAGAFYTTMASRVGMTPEEFYQRYRLRVLGEAPAGQGPVIEQGRELDRNGIPVATMAEVQAVADIPTVEKMAQAMDLLGEAEFERRVQARMRSLGATTPEQQAMVTESVAINAVAVSRADAARGATFQQAAVERLQMVAERGVRATATRSIVSAEERAAIEASAQATGLTVAEIEDAVRRSKLAHPVAQGWEPLVYVRTTVEEVDGEKKPTHEFRKAPYTFSNGADGAQLDPGTANYTRRVNAVARSMVEEVRKVFRRAAQGDRNAQNILAQAGWYKAMRKRLRQEFGGLGDLFADLLGATSPNTPVRDNWFNAVDALRRASRGDFDTLIPQWEAWSDRVDALESDLRAWFNERLAEGLSKKAIKALPEYQAKLGVLREARVLPDALLPKKESGAKYGFNGRNVVRAMVDLWRIVKNADPDIARGGTAPKALNFSGNLIGFRSRATIDVWAARMLQRLSGGRRIPSMAETGVSGEMREDATTTLQFGFGQDVFSRASSSIRNDAELNTDPVLAETNDDDLQAVVWFIEKEVWTVNDWTSAAGEGGSFELEANLTGTSQQAQVKELRRIIDASPPTADVVGAGQDTTAALKAIEDHERQHAAEIEELRKLQSGEIEPYKGSKKRMDELGKIARPPVEATRLLGNVERAKARLENFARRKVAAKAELAALEREVDRFVGGLSIQMSQDTQGVDFVPTDADMALLAAKIRQAIYEADDGNTVLGSKALSTEGRYGGVERSLDLEVVAREGYDPNALWLEMLRQAQAAQQDSTFLSRVLRANEAYDPLTHRPGVEIYLRSAASQAQLEKVLADLAKEGVEFLTVIVDGRRLAETMGGAMPAAVGVRLQYVPEFEQRYGMDDLSGLDDAALAAKIEAKAAELRAIADRVSEAIDGVSFAGQFWYETQVAFSSQYQEKIDALATGVTEEGAAGTPGGQQWAGDSVRAGLESADRQSRETAGGESGGDVLGGDAQRTDAAPGGPEVLQQGPVRDTARDGAGPGRGIHYSRQPRETLDGRYYGTGLKGLEAQRILQSDDRRLRERVYIYLDTGNGVRPEAGVGGYAHEVALPDNLYDAQANPDGLWRGGDLNATESAILDAGYAGYFVRDIGNGQGAAVIIGPASRNVSVTPIADPKRPFTAAPAGPTVYKRALLSRETALVEENLAEVQAAAPSAKVRAGTFSVNSDELAAARQTLERYGVTLPEQAPLAQGPRGTFNPRTLELVLSPTADLSTFFHETGHFFLEVMGDVASQPDAPAMIQEDMAKILAWFGVPDLATWNSMTLDQQRPYHERWAESIEQYVMEGKAPSVELQPLMRRFRAWLTNVYKSIQQFLAGRPDAAQQPLNDDIRRVMDRMLAVDEQIAQANEVAGFMPDEQADGEAAERLQKRSMADLKWAVKARDKVIAKLKREARDIEKQVREQVTAEIDATPEMQAKAQLDALRKSKNLNDITMGAVVDSLGFESVDQMLQAIEAFGNKREVIDGLTEQRMLEEYGDLNDERAIQQAANEAVHNEARARSLATELRTQQEMLGQRRDTGETNARGARVTVSVLVEAAKQFGANVIARTSLKDLRSTAWKHTAAERRAGKRWQEATAKGQTQEAVQAKRDQVLNNAAAKAALDAITESKKILEFFGRVTKGNDEKVVEKGRDPDIVNAARAVLAAYGVQTPASKNAAAYMEAVKKNDPETYAALEPMIAAAMANAQPLEALTFEELQGLNESIRAFWFMAKRSRQMEVDGNLLDIDDVAQELYLRMEQIGIPDRVPGEGMAVTKAEERGLFLKQGVAFLRRVEAWAEGMDGKYGGPFLRFVFQPIKDAADRYRKDRIAYRKRFQALVDNLAPIVGDSVIAAPELGYTFGTPGSTAGTAMNEILHAIAHTGNDSNKRKLLLGRGWATENPDGTLDTSRWDAFIARLVAEGKLTQGHFDFVQGVWDLLEDTKPLAQKAHRDAFGRYFSEVTANEFVDPFGVTRRGGYLPAQVDTRLVKDNLLRKMAEEQNNSMAYSFPQPAKGFTMSRVEYNQPLMLDLRSLSQHIDKVLLFGHMTNPARDVRKLITRKTVSQPLDRLQPATLESMLQPWLQRSSQQIVETPIVGTGRWARIPGIIRARAGMALMFANVSNAIQQVTGLANAAVRVRPSFLMRSLAQYVANPREFSRAVWSASPYMDDRAKNEVSVLNEQMEAILIKPSTYETVRDWSSRHAYFLQTALDNVLSPIVWTGAYNQALAEGMSDADAVRFADSSVRQTQGSTLPEDVSRIETGPAYARAFTQFVGYFNMMANTNATALKQIVGEVGLKRGAGKALYVVMMGLMVPIWAAEAIAIAMRGGPEDEDDDGYLDDWLAEVFGMGTLKGMLAQIPIAGQFGVAAIQRFNDNPLDDRVSLSPAVSLLESAVGAPQSVYKAIVDEGSAQKAIRDVATLVSVATGVPLYGVARPIGYAAGVAQGKIEPEGPIDVARGLITGTASPESKQR